MKKQVHPAVIAVIVVVVVGIVGLLFYKGTATPPPTPMSPLGPGAALLNKAGAPHGMTPDVIQAREKMQQEQGGTSGK